METTERPENVTDEILNSTIRAWLLKTNHRGFFWPKWCRCTDPTCLVHPGRHVVGLEWYTGELPRILVGEHGTVVSVAPWRTRRTPRLLVKFVCETIPRVVPQRRLRTALDEMIRCAECAGKAAQP